VPENKVLRRIPRPEKKSYKFIMFIYPSSNVIRVTKLSLSSTQMLVSARCFAHSWLRTNVHAFIFITQEGLLQMIKQ
jgi:hypothetical protein